MLIFATIFLNDLFLLFFSFAYKAPSLHVLNHYPMQGRVNLGSNQALLLFFMLLGLC